MSLSRMPGAGCEYYRRGRCLYEENLNPGYNAAHLCRELGRLGREFEGFIERAEAFSLEEQKAYEIWRRKLSQSLAQDCHCQDYLGGDNENFLGCAYAYGDICLKALPICPGRCPRFSLEPTLNQK